jgi:hypothetical protein
MDRSWGMRVAEAGVVRSEQGDNRGRMSYLTRLKIWTIACTASSWDSSDVSTR